AGLPVAARELRRLAGLPVVARGRLAPVAHVVDQAVAAAVQLERSRTAARLLVVPEQSAWDLAGGTQPPVPPARALRLERGAVGGGMQLAECRGQEVAACPPIDPVPVHPAGPEPARLSWSH